jgi:cytochrome d ubiquinol oxidase subunit I
MLGLEALELARIQFAFTVSFHILFPAFTIGLASYLAVLEALWLRTGRDEYRDLYKFWVKIFALSFGMGVVSGIVMSYQFGTNWSRFSDATGPILGPLMSYEVITAFFLEAGFLGIMLFGWERVGKGLHFFATCMVALGTLISSFWILSANSWMHTPAGYELVDGIFMPADWWAIIFNPSFPYRLAHMVIAAYLTTAFVVGAVGAWHLLRGRRDPATRTMFSMAMWMAALVAPVQLVVGDLHGLNTLEHQPAKIAAMEGHFETQRGAPLILFGLPDSAAGEVRHQLAIPKLGSLILTHEWDGEVLGLDAFPREDWPLVGIVFWSFRIMVAVGMAMILVGLASLWLRWRGRLFAASWLHRAVLVMGPSGFVAVLAGWITTEVGRQPWVVYGMMRTAEGVTPTLAGDVATSLALFVIVYFLVFGIGIAYLLRLMSYGPEEPERGLRRPPGGHRPMAAAAPQPAE